MGYDLCVAVASDPQIEYLSVHPAFTGDFLEGRRPSKMVTEVTTSWFRKQESSRTVPIEVGCPWPDSPPECVELYLRGGLYFLLNGTNDPVDAVTNFPNVGGRYRGELLGKALELGQAGLGHAHAFRSPEVMALDKAVTAIDTTLVEERGRAIATEMDWDCAVEDATKDMAALRTILASARATQSGLIWYWA